MNFLILAALSWPNLALANGSFHALSLNEWAQSETSVAEQRLLANISPSGTHPGAVIASPEQFSPNYYFHWIRDAALVMEVVRIEALRTGPGRENWERHLRDYVYFSRSNQLSSALTGLGEPKFEVDGAPFTGLWGRPQNDGPALRALALVRWAQTLLRRGDETFVRMWLYDPAFERSTVVKHDLSYVAEQWREPSFDVWEELKADHFFTRLTQWQALTEGASLADQLGDSTAAFRFRLEASLLGEEIQLFWNSGANQIDASRNRVDGIDYKKSQTDSAVLIAVLRSDSTLVPIHDPRVGATVTRIVSAFQKLYGINRRAEAPGIAIGRYPEDLYDGAANVGGNPWVLCTLAAAEYYYRLALLQKSENLLRTGDLFFERVKYHANPDGSLSEQMSRDTGFMTSARDLTWSYAAFLTAAWSREEAFSAIQQNKETP